MRKIPISFVEVHVEPVDQDKSKPGERTSFKREDHEKKLLFLVSKFRLNPEVLEEELKSFSREVNLHQMY